MKIEEKLHNCETVPQIFSLVQDVAKKYLDKDQAGLLVGLSDLGKAPNGFVGAFYSLNANAIIVNQRILEKIKRSKPYLYKPYLFHVLLHEYIHSIGSYDELQTRKLTLAIAKRLDMDILVKLAADMGQFFPEIIHLPSYETPSNVDIEFLPGIDRKNLDYIN